MLVYPRGGCGDTTCCLIAHLLSAECLPSKFGTGVWWHGALLFSQCNVAQRNFVWAAGSYKALIPVGGFFPAKCGSSISARVLIHGAHTVCFCAIVTILDPPHKFFFFNYFTILLFYFHKLLYFLQTMKILLLLLVEFVNSLLR
jgi:hypothetical protein